MTTPIPMKSHAPGWTLEVTGFWYRVWGPGEITHDGYPTGKTRDHWSACWRSTSGDAYGDYVRGSSRDEVLAIFPPKVADQFCEVVT